MPGFVCVLRALDETMVRHCRSDEVAETGSNDHRQWRRAGICGHQKTGFVTPAGDARSLAQRIDELYLDRHLAERIGKAAEQKVCESTGSRPLTGCWRPEHP